MASTLAGTIRVETSTKVLRYVGEHGPCTARAIAFGLYGAGRPGTRERARVYAALTALEDRGQVARDRPEAYKGGAADMWRALQ